MNKKFVVVLGVLALAILLFVFLGQEEEIESPPETVEIPEPKKSPVVIEEAEVTVVESSQEEETSMEALTREYLEKSMSIPNYEWKQPIEFYGKVVTLDGQPIEGVTVEYGMTVIGGYDTRTVQSDADGSFELTGVKGKTLRVTLKKEGYDWFKTRTQMRFEFAEPYDPQFHKADPNEPLIYYMRERPEAEPLYVHRNKSGAAYSNAMKAFYDFRTGRFSQKETDESVQFVAEIESYDPESSDPYDWSVTLSGEGLQFLLSETYIVVEAPEEGFGDELKLGFDRASDNWNGALDETVFFRTASGHYGYLRLGLTVRAKSNKVGVLLSSYFNPSSSRVLVFDSGKRIR